MLGVFAPAINAGWEPVERVLELPRALAVLREFVVHEVEPLRPWAARGIFPIRPDSWPSLAAGPALRYGWLTLLSA